MLFLRSLAALAAAAGLAAAIQTGAAANAPLHPAVVEHIEPVTAGPADSERLIASMGAAQFVLLGEATHGTREFYKERARTTLRLVSEAGFGAVIIEGDWADTDRVNRYVRGLSHDTSAEQALSSYDRFPTWMWRNAEFLELVEALRVHNLALAPERRVGVYGMDVYDIFHSADEVLAHLSSTAPEAAVRARAQYRCFARFRRSTSAYGEATRRGGDVCKDEAQAVLAEVSKLPAPSDPAAREGRFSAVRNAAVVVAGEAYFRAAYSGVLAWNVRDRSMQDTIEAVAAHVGGDQPGKVVVWAHNSHVGDASATEMPRRGEINIGQLLREAHPGKVFSLGFLTSEGTVMAAHDWDGAARTRRLRPPVEGSDAAAFRAHGVPRFVLHLRNLGEGLLRPMLQRAVGVIYRPDTEMESHYGEADLEKQFDAVVYLDQTTAVTPLGRSRATRS